MRLFLIAVMILLSTGPLRAESTAVIAVAALPGGGGNPYSATYTPSIYVWEALFDALTDFDGEGSLIPRLATGWEQVEPTLWHFTLRGSVFFSNGESLTSEAVVRSLQIVRDDPSAAPHRGSLAGFLVAEVVDTFTVAIRTRTPNLFLPRELSGIPIIAPAAWDRLGAEGFAREPVGTGPYIARDWQTGRVVLERAPQAWRPGRIDRLDIVESPQTAARLQGLLSGQIDIAYDLNPDDVRAVRRAGGSVLATPLGVVFGFAYLLEGRPDNPLQDIRVRRALNHGVDVEGIIEALLAGATVRSGQTTPRGTFGFDPALAPFAYDPDLARRLLAEAGHGDGLALTVEATIGAGANDAAVYQAVASDLAEIGVDLTIRPIPVASLIRKAYHGGWDGHAFATTWGAVPGLDGLRNFRLNSCDWVAPWFCDPDIHQRYLAAREAPTLAAREAMTRAALGAMREAVPGLLLYEGFALYGMGARVSGFRNDFGRVRYHLLEVAP